MKIRARFTMPLTAILLTFLSAGADAAEFQKVEPSKVPDELVMLAAVTKANYEKIKTWQGKISSESMYIYGGAYAADILKRDAGVKSIKEPNELVMTGGSTIEFKMDLGKNHLFRHQKRSKETEYTDTDKGLTYTSLSGLSEGTKIIAGEYEMESYPDRWKKDGTILGRIARKRPRKQSQLITDNSNPRYCFGIGKQAWVLLSELSEGVRCYNQDPNGVFVGMPNSAFSYTVLEKAQTAKGVKYRIKFTMPGEDYEEITFDGEKGFNPTYIEVKNVKGIKISEVTRDFIKIQGIFLPTEQQVVQYDEIDGCLRREAKSTFSEMKVNIELPENTFSINNLGLCNGDKFVDNIEGKEYRYQDANLVPIADVNQ